MKKVVAIAGIFALMASLMVVAPQAAKAAPPRSNQLSIPLSTSTAGSTLNGTFTLTSFAIQDGKLVANGIVSGSVSNGSTTSSFLRTVTAPVSTGSSSTTAAAIAAACPILHLVIGPIDLNVLGLVVTTNQIVLDITAVPGAGNLLGNLLCDVANLLNNNPTATLVGLLNQIIAILQGL